MSLTKDIESLLPHRKPFLFVDEIVSADEKGSVSTRTFTEEDFFFQGHFPGNPSMPGVVQVEAMVQTGGVLVLNTVPDPENYWTYFLGIESFRFRKMVVPGDTLILKCELISPIKRLIK